MRVFAGPLLATASGDWQFVIPFAIMLATSVAASLATAQTVPLTATKTRVTYEVRPSGAIVLTQEERGPFSRNSDGDEATQLKRIRNGQPVPGSSLINRHKEAKSYIINDAQRQYTVKPWSGNPAATTEANAQSPPPVTRTIAGIKCVAVSMRDDKTGRVVGKNWISPEYGIAVRSERDVVDPQTGQLIGLVVEELADIQLGVAPEPMVFTIPAGYTETGPQHFPLRRTSHGF
jgi:hypothetical protein